jgi:hypothetical protein
MLVVAQEPEPPPQRAARRRLAPVSRDRPTLPSAVDPNDDVHFLPTMPGERRPELGVELGGDVGRQRPLQHRKARLLRSRQRRGSSGRVIGVTGDTGAVEDHQPVRTGSMSALFQLRH